MTSELQRVLDAGAMLSNAAYNIAQDDRVPDRFRASLRSSQVEWDAAMRAWNERRRAAEAAERARTVPGPKREGEGR